MSKKIDNSFTLEINGKKYSFDLNIVKRYRFIKVQFNPVALILYTTGKDTVTLYPNDRKSN